MREQQSKYETAPYMKVATDIMFTKMSAKSGIKKFGEKTVADMIKQYRQINKGPMEGKPVVTYIDHETLSYKDKRKAIKSVNLIKEKRTRISKRRKCSYVS